MLTQKRYLQNFIYCLMENNFARANKQLDLVIEAKLKDRINKSKKKSEKSEDDAIQVTKPGSKKKKFLRRKDK